MPTIPTLLVGWNSSSSLSRSAPRVPRLTGIFYIAPPVDRHCHHPSELIPPVPPEPPVPPDPNEVMALSVIFEQWDGDFVYPVCAIAGGAKYFLSESISGESKVKYIPIPADPNNVSCDFFSGGIGLSATGIVHTIWSGLLQYDMDCNKSGSLDVELNRAGWIGAYDIHSLDGVTSFFSADTLEDLYLQLHFHRGAFGWLRYEEERVGDQLIRTWSTPMPFTGYYSGAFGGQNNSVPCVGFSMVNVLADLITPETLNIVVARSGGLTSDARTQYIESQDTDTNTLVGNISRATFTLDVDVTKPTITGTFVYLVTPDVGDPYRITIMEDYPISGSPMTIQVWFPAIVAATVYMESWDFNYLTSVFDDFGSYAINDYFELNSIGSWPFLGTFICSHPNTDSWDDFRPRASGVLSDPQSPEILSGHCWDGNGQLLSRDRIDAYDDFEGYTAGSTLTLYGQGVGWLHPGTSFLADYAGAYDEFESYDTGPITILTFQDPVESWQNVGTLILVNYISAFDDFESYPTGSITELDFAGPDNFWSDVGILIL